MTLLNQRSLIGAMILLLFGVLIGISAGQTNPNSTAFPTFETLHKAEASGANIKNLVDQYNALLSQQNQSDLGPGFAALASQAIQAQTLATSNRNASNLSTIILVPVAALILAIASIALVSVIRRIRENRLLDMRIGRS